MSVGWVVLGSQGRVARYLGCLLCLLATLAQAASADASGSPEALARRLVDAVRAGDRQARLELVHPGSRACMTENTSAYYEWFLEKQAHLMIAPTFEVSVQRISSEDAEISAPGQVGAVTPSHQLELLFRAGEQRTASLVVLAVQAEGGWLEVLPCVGPEAAAAAADRLLARQRLEARVAELVEGMAPALRAELAALLGEGRKVDAIRRHAEVSGEDLSVAKAVVERLQGQSGASAP